MGTALAGRCLPSQAAVYSTRDGGQQWTRVGQLPTQTINVVFQSAHLGYALRHVKTPAHPKGQVHLLETTNGGRSWQPLSVQLPLSSSGLFLLPGNILVVETLDSLVAVHHDHISATVQFAGSAAHALLLDGIVPLQVDTRLEIFVLGEGMWSSPWQRRMVLRESAG